MTLIRLPYVQEYRDRHGKARRYFRRPGFNRVTLPGTPGSPQFMAAYEAALIRRPPSDWTKAQGRHDWRFGNGLLSLGVFREFETALAAGLSTGTPRWRHLSYSPIYAQKGATFSAPFGTNAPPPPPAERGRFSGPACRTSHKPNRATYPTGNLFGPFLFGGYDINNKLPYTENWTFDLQYQPWNSWLFSAGYVGNHGHHDVLPNPLIRRRSPRRNTPSTVRSTPTAE